MSTVTWGKTLLSREQQHRMKREVLLRTAAQAFTESGYFATSLNDLAKRLNISKPTLYYYVKNKDDILYEVQRLAMAAMQEAIFEAKRSSESGRQRLKMVMLRYAEVINDDFGRCSVVTGLQALTPESREKILADRRILIADVQHVIEAGIEDGSIKTCDPKLLTQMLFSIFNGICFWPAEDKNAPVADIAGFFMSTLEQGIASAQLN